MKSTQPDNDNVSKAAADGLRISYKNPDKADSEANQEKLLSRLEEMEMHNAGLEILLEQRTAKLSEIISTNGKFLSVIAHDLRSPFSSIIGILELLKMSLNDFNRDQIEEYVNIVYNSANNTLDLLDNLLVWAVSQNKEKNFKPVRINIYKLLSEEIENLKTLAGQKQIEIYQNVEPDVDVAADLQMVKTIIRNLIGNAIKYTNTNGKIEVNASITNELVEIAVCDNGVGMSDNDQKKLFKIDKFHSTPGTKDEPGTGLGLLLCKEFAGLHGSDLQIKSEPGIGSRFAFTLPHFI